MSFEIRVRPRARRDLEEAARWYETQSAGLGGEFLDEVRDSCSRISEQPSLYPEVHRATRRALLHRFPFGVFYRIVGDVIAVVAVMHSSRHPHRWMSRT